MVGWLGGLGESVSSSAPSRTGRRLSVAAATLVLALCAASSVVEAGGHFLPLRGVRPTGRAGAVTVSGAGANALWYNPANLAALDGTHVLFDFALVDLETSFLRSPSEYPSGEQLFYSEVINEKGPDFIPSLIVTSDLSVDHLALSLGFMPPYGARYRYPVDGAQRYSAIDNALAASFAAELAAAYEVTDWFRVGAGFQWFYFNTQIVTMASAYEGPFGQPEDEDLDILLRLTSEDPFTPAANFGVWFQIFPGLEAAAALQTGARIEDPDALLELRLPTHPLFDEAEVDGDTVSGGFNIPVHVRGGLRFVHDLGDIEANLTWAQWSVHDAITTTPNNVRLVGVPSLDEFRIGPMTVEMDWQDTWIISVGGDFIVLPDQLTLRAGFLYETGAIPQERLCLFQYDTNKFAPTLGLSYMVPETGLSLDLSYAHLFFESAQITDSLVRQLNPTFEEGAVIVGNGAYESNVDILGFGMELAL